VLDGPGAVSEARSEEDITVKELLELATELDTLRVVGEVCRSSSAGVSSSREYDDERISAAWAWVARALAEIWPFEMLTDEVVVKSWVLLAEASALDVEFGT
jgi:hypothetical protein